MLCIFEELMKRCNDVFNDHEDSNYESKVMIF